jgi:flagellin-like hook-associated protein FlgL
MEVVKKIAESENIRLASITAIGATDDFTVGIFDRKKGDYKKIHFTGDHEIIGIQGSITTIGGKFRGHMHITCSNPDGDGVYQDWNDGDGVVGFNMAGIALVVGSENQEAFDQANITANGTTDNTTGFVVNNTDLGGGLSFDISTAEGAQKVLGCIDSFIQVVDSKRAELGAVQNRLESTIRNQSNIHENVSDARSRIRDTDFATETANMTEQSIIQQASQAILSQANSRPQLALSLLG